jgi:hypothetical protein
MTNEECVQYSDDLAELALGVLSGRERAGALAHVDTCPRCAEELEQLSRTADAVVAMAPEAEPPLGFETRLFARMGIEEAPVARQHRFKKAWLPVTIAAAVVALAIGLGFGLSSSPSTSPRAQSALPKGAVDAGPLVEHGATVGKVVVFGGDKPWMQMTLADSTARGVVHCVVVTRDGVTHQLGSFTASEGYGAWAAPLHVDPASVRSAEVMSPSGTVIATATLG